MELDPFEHRSPFERLKDIRRERLLNEICILIFWIAFPVLTPFFILALAVPSWQTTITFIVPSLSVPLSRYVQSLARAQKIDLGGIILLSYFLIMIGLNGLLIEGLFPAVAIAYAPFILIAGMILEPPGRYLIALLGAIFWMSSNFLISQEVVEGIQIPDVLLTILETVIVLGMFFMIAWLSKLALDDTQRALDDTTFELVQKNRELGIANRMKTQFTARTSHELRTPLSAIMVFTELALRKAYGPLPEKLEENLERVLFNVKRLTALIDDILDLSKIEAGEIVLVKSEFPAQSLMDTLSKSLQPQAEAKGLKFRTNLAPNLPNQLCGDENRVKQVLINLVSNAIKFTDNGEIEVSIDLADSEYWRIRVRDTGRGIHEENLETIFEEFSQDIATNDTHPKGTGLGLAISHHLVHIMGGRIDVVSKLGKGSTFEVLLPLKKTSGISASNSELS